MRVSLHPAGHLLGSAQVRVEHRGEVWVVGGDYKVEHDATCTPFEPVRCHTLITESTFALPIYKDDPQIAQIAQIKRQTIRTKPPNPTHLRSIVPMDASEI